ncbi:MAG: CsgG/HfaB family protein [Verrucomicrobiota bacterium]
MSGSIGVRGKERNTRSRRRLPGSRPKNPTLEGGGLLRFNGFPGGFNVHKSENEVQIDWRIVDTTTRVVVKSGRGTGMKKGNSFSFGGWAGHGFSNDRQFMDSALGKATLKAIACIVTELETWTPPVQYGRRKKTNYVPSYSHVSHVTAH